MTRGTLALMDRALRVDSRSLRTHLIRFSFVCIIVWCMTAIKLQSNIASAPGLRFIEFMLMITLLLITLSGASSFATAITEEKEERTLGLLRMAGVGPGALLLGKGFTRILSALLILGVQFPFMLLAITLGGVLVHQIWAAYLAICAYLLLVGAAGLFLSVVFRTSRSASFAMLLLLLASFFSAPVLRPLLAAATGNGTLDPYGAFSIYADMFLERMSDANIFSRIPSILHSGFHESAISFQVLSHSVGAIAFFALSWLLFDRFNREDREPDAERPLFARRTARSRWFTVPPPWKNALIWKDFFYTAGGWPMMVAKFVLYGVILAAICLFSIVVSAARSGAQIYEIEGYVAIWVSLTMLVVELLLYSSRSLRDEIRNRTLSGIAMLPTSIPRILYSKWTGCLLALLPAATYLAIGVMLVPKDVADVLSDASTEPWFYYTVLQVVVGFHLCVLLSTYVKYGALALAIALVLVGNFLMIVTVDSLMYKQNIADALGVFFCVVSLIAVILVHIGILIRVQTLAAE